MAESLRVARVAGAGDARHADRWLAPGPEWRRCESQLEAAGVPLAFVQRAVSAEAERAGAWRFLAVRDDEERCRCGFAVREEGTRALPGHRIWRVERFGAAADAASRAHALTALAARARTARRVLRVELGVVERDPERAAALAREAERAGFAPSPSPRLYRDTIAIDLRRDLDAILAGFKKQTRKNLRRMEREPFAVRPLEDPACAERMERLLAETMGRTGGPAEAADWRARIRVAREHPGLSRLAGLFRDPGQGPEALVAFGWAVHNGDHVEYRTTASTRIAGSRLPLTYGLAWDLLRWARERGAAWFDFGGVSAGGLGSEDPLGGISDFKRSFGGEVTSIGSEWIFEPRPLLARVARGAGALRRAVRGRRRS